MAALVRSPSNTFDGWADLQKRTYLTWCNAMLKHIPNKTLEIKDIIADLKDGVLLSWLVQAASGSNDIKRNEPGDGKELQKMKAVENHNGTLAFLQSDGVKLVGVGAQDIYDGTEKLILGLIWTLIIRYQIGSSGGGNAKQMLQTWITDLDPNLKVSDFNKSWSDGKLLAKITNILIPNGISQEEIDSLPPVPLTHRAQEVARDALGIPIIIAAEDLIRANQENLYMMNLSYLRNWHQEKTFGSSPVPRRKEVPHVTPIKSAELAIKEPESCTVDGLIDPQASTATTVPPQFLGSQAIFTVHVLDGTSAPISGGNDINIVVYSPDLTQSNVIVKEQTSNPSHYDCSFTPNAVGTYQLAISWKERVLHKGLYSLQIGDGSSAKEVAELKQLKLAAELETSAISKEKDSIIQEKNDLSESVVQLQSQGKAKDDEIENLKAKLVAMSTQLEEKRQENQALDTSRKLMEQSLKEHQSSITETEAQLVEKTNSLTAKDEVLEKMDQTLKQNSLELKSKDERIKELESALKSALEGSSDDQSKSEAELAQLKEQMLSLQDQVQEKEAENKSIKLDASSMIEMQEKKIEELERRNNSLMESLTSSSADNKILVEKLNAYESSMSKLKGELSKLEEDKSKLEGEKSKLESEKTKLESENHNLEVDLANNVEQNSDLSKKMVTVQAENEKLKRQIGTYLDDHEALRISSSANEERVNELQASLEEKEDVMRNMLERDIPAMRSTIKFKDEEISKLKERTKKLAGEFKEEVTKLLAQQASYLQEMDKLKGKVSAYSKQLIDLQDKVAHSTSQDVEALHAELQKMSIKNEEMQKNINKLEAEMQEAMRKAEALMVMLHTTDSADSDEKASNSTPSSSSSSGTSIAVAQESYQPDPKLQDRLDAAEEQIVSMIRFREEKQAQITELTKSNQETTELLSILDRQFKYEMANKNEKVSNLNHQLSNAEAKVQELQAENDELKRTIDETRRLGDDQKASDSNASELEKLKHSELQSNTQQALDAAISERDALKRQLDEIKSQMEEEKSQMKEEQTQLKTEQNQLKSYHDQLKSDTNQLQSNFDELKSIHNQLQSDHNQLNTELEQLKADHNQLISDHHQLQSNHNQLNTELEQLKTDYEQLKQENQTLRHEKDSLSQLKDGSDTDKASLVGDIESLKAENDQLRSKKSELESQKSKLEIEKSILESNKSSLETANSFLESEKSQLQIQNSSLEESQAQLLKDQASLNLDKVNLEAAKSNLTSERDQLKEELERLKVAMSNIESSKTQLEKDHNKLKHEKSLLEQSKDGLDSDRATLIGDNATLQSENDELKRFKASLEEEREKLIAAIKSLTEDKQRLKHDNINLQKEKDLLSREKDQLLIEKNQLSNQNDQLSFQNSGLQQPSTDILSKSSRDLDLLNEVNRQLNEDLMNAKNTIKSQNDAQNELDKLRREHEVAVARFAQQLTEVENAMRDEKVANDNVKKDQNIVWKYLVPVGLLAVAVGAGRLLGAVPGGPRPL